MCWAWDSCWAGWLTVTLLPSASRHNRGTHYLNCGRDFFILCCDDMSDWCIQWSIRGVKVHRHRSAGFSWWWGPHWVCTFFDLLSWMNDYICIPISSSISALKHLYFLILPAAVHRRATPEWSSGQWTSLFSLWVWGEVFFKLNGRMRCAGWIPSHFSDVKSFDRTGDCYWHPMARGWYVTAARGNIDMLNDALRTHFSSLINFV